MEQEPKKRGRKKKAEDDKKKAHQVYATDVEWAEIEKRAKAVGKDVSPYIIEKAFLPDRTTNLTDEVAVVYVRAKGNVRVELEE